MDIQKCIISRMRGCYIHGNSLKQSHSCIPSLFRLQRLPTSESLLCCDGLLFFGCLSGRLKGVSLFTCRAQINLSEWRTWLLKSGRRAGCLKKKYLGYVLHDDRITEALIGFSLGFSSLPSEFSVLCLFLYTSFSLYSLCFKLPIWCLLFFLSW